jgi:hypothetical protein
VSKRGHRKRKDRPRRRGRGKNKNTIGTPGEDFDVCEVCKTALSKSGGYANSGMCGPCCTGEAETLEEFGETW